MHRFDTRPQPRQSGRRESVSRVRIPSRPPKISKAVGTCSATDKPSFGGKKLVGVNPNEEQSVEILTEAVRSTIRFPALANAGGAIGTISIVGATAKDGDVLNILALPLGLFLLGIFLSLLAGANILYGFARDKALRDKKPVTPLLNGFDWIRVGLEKQADALHLVPIALFFLGCLSGIIIIAISRPAAPPAPPAQSSIISSSITTHPPWVSALALSPPDLRK